MQHIPALNPDNTTGKAKELFDAVNSKLGMVPNLMRTVGNSPAALSGYLSLNAALGESSLGARTGELIAIAVANANGCAYCNAAHTFIGQKLVHIDQEALSAAREGQSAEPKIQLALEFSRALVQKRGHVSALEIAALKDAGYSDEAVAEIIGHVALNILTNYFNNALAVEIDFPQTDLVESAAIH